MTSVFVTRRGAVRSIALAATIPFACGRAIGATAAVVDRRTAATAALLRVAFPHGRLAPDFYRGVAETYLREIAAKPAATAEHDRGLALLDGNHIAPFANLPAVIQKGLVERIDQEPFFKAILWRGAELIYRDRSVWKMVGYESSSLEYGGYHDRGFDDIDWLPRAGAGTGAQA
nr:hypothetical protein [Sphingomonas sp. Y57]